MRRGLAGLSLLLACGGGDDSVGPTPSPSAPSPAIVTVGVISSRGDNGGLLFSVRVGQYDTITAVPGTEYQILSLRQAGAAQGAKVLVVGRLPDSGPMFRIHLTDGRQTPAVYLEQAAIREVYSQLDPAEYEVYQDR